MRKNIILFIITLAILTSCSKEGKLMEPKEQKGIPTRSSSPFSSIEDNILHFDSFDSLYSIQNTLSSYNNEDRLTWERNNSFKSFMSKCEELYQNLDTTSSTCIYNFANTYDNYFYISSIDNEPYLTTYLEDSPMAYFINHNRIISIGNNYMKFFDEGYIVADEEYLDSLYCIESFDSNNQSDYLEYVQYPRRKLSKKTFESESGRDKLRK